MAVDCEPTAAAVVAMAAPTVKNLDMDEGRQSDTSTASTEDTAPLSPTSSFSSIRPASPPSQSLSVSPATPASPPTRSASIIAAERIRARYLQRLGVKVSTRVDQNPPLLTKCPDADGTVSRRSSLQLVRFQSVVEVHRFDASIDADLADDVDVNVEGKKESESAMAAIERNCREFEMEQWNWQLVVEEDDFIEYNGQLVHPATAQHLQDVRSKQERYMRRNEGPLTYPSRTHHSAQHQFLRVLSAQQQFHRHQRQASYCESSDWDCEPPVAHGYYEDDF